MKLTQEEQNCTNSLLAYIDASPTPWHAVDVMAGHLKAAGFRQLREEEAWTLKAGDACFVTRAGSALAAFIVGSNEVFEEGFRIVGAHTDSPGLRVKAEGIHEKHGMIRLGVEVYGGAILASWTDRELSLAGRIVLRDDKAQTGIRTALTRIDEPLLRLPNLAIHLNREVNNLGLKLDKQEGMPLLLGAASDNAGERLLDLCCERAGASRESLLEFELCAFDVQPSALYGLDGEYLAAGRIDNLAMCHAGMQALLDLRKLGDPPASTSIGVFYDNEEVGSQSAQGADGSFLPDLLERLQLALELSREDFRRACSRSFLVSADMAHALHPNGASFYEPQHHVFLNEGPVVKLNANLRYTSSATSTARFGRCCEAAGVPMQRYVHRTDLACGSTIGPMASANLGIEGVDVGNPMLAMHSIRECAGSKDHLMMVKALGAVFAGV